MDSKRFTRRLIALGAAMFLCALVFVVTLFDAQIVNGDDYLDKSIRTNAKTETVKASRGILTDRNGKVLVSNRAVYTLNFDSSLVSSDELNDALLRVIELMNAQGVEIKDALPLARTSPYAYDTANGSAKTLVKYLVSLKWINEKNVGDDGLPTTLTGSALYLKLRSEYGIDETLPNSTVRTLIGLRYSLASAKMNGSTTFEFASDVDVSLISLIKDGNYAGVQVDTSSVRVYETDYAAHVLGYTGSIQDWDDYKDKDGYTLASTVGISGVENAFEDYLHGNAGKRLVTFDNDSGKITGELYTREPQPGVTVALTIDIDLQQVVEDTLASTIQGMIDKDSNERGGAAAVIQVGTGEVLAMASYPTYDLETFNQDYDELVKDERLPMFNRATQGVYAPGSTFKPAVAVAALDSGLINRYSTVFCNGVYNYYSDYHPKCTRHGHSGNIDVITAIKWSCNIFFYDVGRRLTSEVYDAYAYKLGMGVRTGVEVSEALGHLTSKTDSNYIESLDVQAAIGQGNTVVSPVQLATYAATIANRGTRYRTHFVKAILDSNTGEVLQETQPEVMDVIEDRGETFDLVQQGMIGVSQTIPVLASYPYTIACKTGTPQRSEGYYVGSTYKHYTNTTMIAYGPAEDPQIAIGIVVEYGGGGARAGNLVADIFNAWFAAQDGTLNEDGTIGKQETAADSTSAAQTAPAQTETGTDAAADTATDPAAGTTEAAQETAPAGQDVLDN